MFRNLWVDQLAAKRPQAFEGTFFVGTHKPSVAGNVRGKNGGQPAFYALLDQSGAP